MQSCGRPVGGAAREGNMDCGIRAAMQTDGVYDSRTSPPKIKRCIMRCPCRQIPDRRLNFHVAAAAEAAAVAAPRAAGAAATAKQQKHQQHRRQQQRPRWAAATASGAAKPAAEAASATYKSHGCREHGSHHTCYTISHLVGIACTKARNLAVIA